MMIVFLIIIIILALAIYWGYKNQRTVFNFLDRFKLGSKFLNWLHSVAFDFRMEDPDRVPKQITWGFIAIVIIIGLVALLFAGSSN